MILAASEIKQVEEQVRGLYYASMLHTTSEMNFEMCFAEGHVTSHGLL